jgi:predicted CXXCH cytochrome family protein
MTRVKKLTEKSKGRHPDRFIGILILLAALGAAAIFLAIRAGAVHAAPAPAVRRAPNDFCLACHQQEGLHVTLGADKLPVTIDPTEFGLSVHAKEGIGCTDCHTNISEYPHPAVEQKSARAFSVSYYDSCKGCHQPEYANLSQDQHQKAFEAGNEKAPVCADCHDPHTQQRIIGQGSQELTISARLHIPEACAKCHDDKYQQYLTSVHGKALTEEGNTDVPTCTNCHKTHSISDPQAANFRNNTPQLCAKCHTDHAIMDKYGLPTTVVDTYVADFHGTTVKLFSGQFPDLPTDKAVCTDCHGVHDITDPFDPKTGIALRENLLVKCQKCHPDATANFPDAWMHHYVPSLEHYPIVFFVNLFYKIMIPTIIGGMILFILTDIYRRRVNRTKGAKHS